MWLQQYCCPNSPRHRGFSPSLQQICRLSSHQMPFISRWTSRFLMFLATNQFDRELRLLVTGQLFRSYISMANSSAVSKVVLFRHSSPLLLLTLCRLVTSGCDIMIEMYKSGVRYFPHVLNIPFIYFF